MSIIVRGMEMPTDCNECPLLTHYPLCGQTWCRACNSKLADNFEPIPFDGRPDWCPLVELPEKHGRLIDMDKLKADYGMKDDCADCDKELRNKSKSCEYDRIYSKMDFCGWLDDATVVIETEGEEE